MPALCHRVSQDWFTAWGSSCLPQINKSDLLAVCFSMAEQAHLGVKSPFFV